MRPLFAIALAVTGFAVTACGGTHADSNSAEAATSPPTGVSLKVVDAAPAGALYPGGTIALSAAADRQGRSAAGGDRFVWHAQIQPSGSYRPGSGVSTAPCAEVKQKTSSGTVIAYAPDVSSDVATDPGDSSTVHFTAPAALPPAAGSTIDTVYPYCVTITAEAVSSGAAGAQTATAPQASVTVAVSDPSTLVKQ